LLKLSRYAAQSIEVCSFSPGCSMP
jgi:hypothetical protein